MDEPYLDDIDDAELREFATAFAAARPQLPRAAFDRVAAALDQTTAPRRPRRLRAAAALTVAASLLIATGAGLLYVPTASTRRDASPVAETRRAIIEERFVMALPQVADDGERRPLVPLAEYHTLIAATEQQTVDGTR